MIVIDTNVLSELMRPALEIAAHRTLSGGFAGPALPFDTKAADIYADIIAQRRRNGRSTGALDMMIAAIAKSHGAAVATRNIDDFDDCGIDLHDPWAG